MQGYRLGDRAWGIQAHVEVDAAELDWWLDIADSLMDVEAAWGKSPARIRAEAERFGPAQEERGREIFRRFAGFVREHASA
jgi:hypothetical protein